MWLWREAQRTGFAEGQCRLGCEDRCCRRNCCAIHSQRCSRTKSKGDVLGTGLDPVDEVDLELGVFTLVHLVQNVGKLEDELVVLNLEGLVGSSVGQADGETHRTRKA